MLHNSTIINKLVERHEHNEKEIEALKAEIGELLAMVANMLKQINELTQKVGKSDNT